MTLLLGVDAGTTSLKVGLFDHTGTELATAVEQYTLLTPAPDRAELDPELYWSSLAAGVSRTLQQAGARASEVAAMAVSSQGETLIPLASEGTPLGPAIVWLDNRAVAEARQLGERFERSTVYAVTGVPAVVPSWPACKLLWWRRNDPELFRRAAHYCLVEEFLLHRLTGRLVSEAGVQSTSLLYDIVRHTWWQAMLDALDLPASRLGELVSPGEVVGPILPGVAEALGLSPGVLVVAGGMDQGAGAVGVGNVIPGLLSESTGGALTLQATVDHPGGDPSGQTPLYVHSAPDSYLFCPVGPTGGMALTWFRDHFAMAELQAAAGRGADSAYNLLTEMAAAVPAGADGLTMLPHLAGAFSPEYEPSARGVFFGFTLAHGRAHFVRAIMEGVAFMLRRNVTMLGELGITAQELCSHGGGARSSLWNQIKADICSMPVVTLRGTEAAVRGDAMLAGVATGVFATLAQASEAAVRPAARFEPDRSTEPAYESAYQRYIDLFEAVRPLFNRPQPPIDPSAAQQPIGHQAGSRGENMT
ncbi:MAG: xylulokinase [Candidatus Dormibacteria bacterium]|jgi:xylulokinase